MGDLAADLVDCGDGEGSMWRRIVANRGTRAVYSTCPLLTACALGIRAPLTPSDSQDRPRHPSRDQKSVQRAATTQEPLCGAMTSCRARAPEAAADPNPVPLPVPLPVRSAGSPIILELLRQGYEHCDDSVDRVHVELLVVERHRCLASGGGAGAGAGAG